MIRTLAIALMLVGAAMLISGLLAAGMLTAGAPVEPVKEVAAALRCPTLVDPPLAVPDPYGPETRSTWEAHHHAPGLCAVALSPDLSTYRLMTFPDGPSARENGYEPTHDGPCGSCSPLADLAVYVDQPDLTTPVRRCALLSFSPGLTLRCLEKLGFTEPCAQIWAANAANTRKECLGICLRSFLSGEPNNQPDGTLNPCLACDEERSGPVFQAVAGRTRRRSGLPSAIGRDEGEVASLDHTYIPALLAAQPENTSSK